MPEDAGDRALVSAFENTLVPAAQWFKPEFIPVSAGMDAHRTERGLNMSFDGHSVLAGIVQGLADKHCDGRLAMVLEGGYNPDTLARCTRRVPEVMADGEPAVTRELGMDEGAAFHRSAFVEMQ